MSSSINCGQMLCVCLFQDTSCLAFASSVLSLCLVGPPRAVADTHTQNDPILGVSMQQKHNGLKQRVPPPNKGTVRVNNVSDAQLMSHQRSRTSAILFYWQHLAQQRLPTAQVNTTQAAPWQVCRNFKWRNIEGIRLYESPSRDCRKFHFNKSFVLILSPEIFCFVFLEMVR